MKKVNNPRKINSFNIISLFGLIPLIYVSRSLYFSLSLYGKNTNGKSSILNVPFRISKNKKNVKHF